MAGAIAMSCPARRGCAIRVARIAIVPEQNALLAARIFVSGALAALVYAAFRDRALVWLACAALLALDWWICLVLTFSKRIVLEGGEISLSSAIGRRSVRLDNIDHVQIGRLASATPRTIRLVLKSGAPVTWAVGAFGRNLAPILAALAERSRLVVPQSVI
jgi:hypothetical protein